MKKLLICIIIMLSVVLNIGCSKNEETPKTENTANIENAEKTENTAKIENEAKTENVPKVENAKIAKAVVTTEIAKEKSVTTEKTKEIIKPTVPEKSNETVKKDFIKDALKQISETDKQLSKYEKKEATLPPIKEGWEKHKITLWSYEGKPMKVTKTEPDDSGQMVGESAYYFKDGKLLIFKAPFSEHIFENDKMVLWLNGMTPLNDISAQQMKDTSQAILKEMTKILNAFK